MFLGMCVCICVILVVSLSICMNSCDHTQTIDGSRVPGESRTLSTAFGTGNRKSALINWCIRNIAAASSGQWDRERRSTTALFAAKLIFR
uniref:Putative secreted protein n=1 Tax=Anopheles triannulatus TaxID=58253 RepID=A0A2M4B7D2_9DIPT